MDQDELQRMVRRHDAAINELSKVARPVPETFHALGVWASSTHEMVKSLFKTVDSLLEACAEISNALEELAASRDMAESELAKLHRLHQQFEAMQEMFGSQLARAREISPPPLSVIQGGRDESSP